VSVEAYDSTILKSADIGVSVLAQRTFGSAANNNTGDFATATQGSKADAAVVANVAITGATRPKSPTTPRAWSLPALTPRPPTSPPPPTRTTSPTPSSR